MSDHMLVLVEDYNNKNLEISRLEAQLASQQREIERLQELARRAAEVIERYAPHSQDPNSGEVYYPSDIDNFLNELHEVFDGTL